MSWILEGKKVSGEYLGIHSFTGVVVESRVKYGGKVSNTIVLDAPMIIFGDIRERILMDTEDLILL